MLETKYYCDHCKKEVSDGREGITKISLSILLDGRAPNFVRDICGQCMIEFGFVEPKSEKNYISNYVTFERVGFNIIKKIFGR